MNVFSVFDVKTRLFSNPFYARTIDAAARDFTQAVNDPAAMADKFPRDYELFHLGEFDQDTGRLFGSDIPTLVVRGSDILSKE